MLVAGLCRIAHRRCIRVAPFKPQNMSNNAAVCPSGGEIGRAQALQARASGLDAHPDMNPVLLKPESDTGAQVVVQGQRLTRAEAADYGALKPRLMRAVQDSFARLRATYDLVIVEGAGSPAEVNLRQRDIANMGFAVAADVPVVLAGDIDRGGVIAQIVGTQAVMDTQDTAMIAGFMVNKFRGDPRLFDDGYDLIAARTGWAGFGVLPWFHDAWKLPAEDAIDLNRAPGREGIHVVCLAFSRIANFDDLDPLAQESGVRLTMLGPGRAIPGDADLVILPGSKSTRGDLEFLRVQGWDIDLQAHYRRGGHILGLCGGYQMLGRVVRDPEGVDGQAGEVDGLGFLDIDTDMAEHKRLALTDAHCALSGAHIDGYEIHMGRSTGADCARPMVNTAAGRDGAISADGRVMGTYLHGLFTSDAYRTAFLQRLGSVSDGSSYDARVDAVLDSLADHMEAHLDIDGLLSVAR